MEIGPNEMAVPPVKLSQISTAPERLVVRNGRIVLKGTDKKPVLEGWPDGETPVVVVPRDTLLRLLGDSMLLRAMGA